MPAWDDAETREFYLNFYAAAPLSRATALYCERVYGRSLCQHGFADMAQLARLIEVCGLGPASRVLDLGCGTGQITEAISDATGARVHGIDLEPAAIALALARAEAKRDRLTFSYQNRLDENNGSLQCIDAGRASRHLYLARDWARRPTAG